MSKTVPTWRVQRHQDRRQEATPPMEEEQTGADKGAVAEEAAAGEVEDREVEEEATGEKQKFLRLFSEIPMA